MSVARKWPTEEREQYASIEEPKTAQVILSHPKRLRHEPFTLSDIR